MLQIIATLAIFLILVIPMGKYMYHIATYQKTFADKVFNPIDHFIYKICGIKDEEMGWKKYALTLVMVNAVMVFVGYLILRIQNVLFLNPNGIEGMDASLSFNTIISFMTNTNLQHYAGESGLSYASQMCVIIFMMFTSAASGYAACMAFCRGLSGRKMGNFYKDMVRIITRILIPVSLILGLVLVSQGVPQTLMGRQGAVIFGAMAILFAVGLTLCYHSEMAGNPVISDMGVDQTAGNMEGKEVRFGVAQSSLFTTVTTSFTTGTVNNMHDSLTPLGGLVPLLHMMLNCVFGGKGVGLMNMVVYVILAVFICGLMVGRTPEYLNKKIEGKEMKLVAIVILIHPLLVLGFSALAVSVTGGTDGITNPGFHGFTQVLYEYASSAANNGSGFEGLADNSTFWNVTTGLAMFFGRYIAIIAQLAIAGSLLAKKKVNETIGTLRTDNVTFMIILVFIVYIFAALTFFPALALGPIAEHLSMWM